MSTRRRVTDRDYGVAPVPGGELIVLVTTLMVVFSVSFIIIGMLHGDIIMIALGKTFFTVGLYWMGIAIVVAVLHALGKWARLF